MIENNAFGNSGDSYQFGVVHGGVHLKVVTDDEGRKAVYRPGRRPGLAVPQFTGWHPEGDRRAQELWRAWNPAESAVALFRIHGPSGSGLSATARFMCDDWLEAPASGRGGTVRAVDLGSLPVRRVLQELLRDMGVPDEMLGSHPEGLSGLFRTVTRDQGPLALIVKNPRSASDIRRLMPGARGSLVMVVGGIGGDTVPHPDFGPIPVRSVEVGPLSEERAHAWLERELRSQGVADTSGEDRKALLDRYGRTMRGIRRAALEHRRAKAGEEEDTVVSVDAAYKALDPSDRMLVGLLALVGSPVGLRVLTSALPKEETVDRLTALEALGLVEMGPGKDGPRYRLHSDLREIAEARWAGFDGAEARDALTARFCAACHSLALDAHLVITPDRALVCEERTASRTFADKEEAKRWLREERVSLEQAVYLAAESTDFDEFRALRLCQVLWALYFGHSLYNDVLSTHEPVLEQAGRAAEVGIAPALLIAKVRSQLVRALLEMSDAQRDRLDDAEWHARQAVEEASGDAGPDVRKEERALLISTAQEMLAEVLAARGRLDQACEHQYTSLAYALKSGDGRAVLIERQKLARLLARRGEPEEARRQLRDAWTGVKELPNRDLYNEGRILMSQAALDVPAGDHASAEARLAQAQEAFERAESGRRVADVLAQRAELRVVQGRRRDALRELVEARRWYEQLGRGVDLLRTDERIKELESGGTES